MGTLVFSYLSHLPVFLLPLSLMANYYSSFSHYNLAYLTIIPHTWNQYQAISYLIPSLCRGANIDDEMLEMREVPKYEKAVNIPNSTTVLDEFLSNRRVSKGKVRTRYIKFRVELGIFPLMNIRSCDLSTYWFQSSPLCPSLPSPIQQLLQTQKRSHHRQHDDATNTTRENHEKLTKPQLLLLHKLLLSLLQRNLNLRFLSLEFSIHPQNRQNPNRNLGIVGVMGFPFEFFSVSWDRVAKRRGDKETEGGGRVSG